MRLEPFLMERWQSTWEHQVAFNLSESGVHPMTVRELLTYSNTDLRRSMNDDADVCIECDVEHHHGAHDLSSSLDSLMLKRRSAVLWRLRVPMISRQP